MSCHRQFSLLALLCFMLASVAQAAPAGPDLSTSTMTVTRAGGGALLPGDVLTFVTEVVNTGDEAATALTLTSVLPLGLTYLPGSLSVNASPITDASGDDAGEYLPIGRTIQARLVGVFSAFQGSLAVGDSLRLSYQATVDALCSGHQLFANQAQLQVSGTTVLGLAFQTDSDSAIPGAQTTDAELSVRCLTLNLLGPGNVTLSPGTNYRAIDASRTAVVTATQVTLQALPTAPAGFSHWSGGASGVGAMTPVLLHSDLNVSAHFVVGPLPRIAAVPTNSPWGLLLLAAVLGGVILHRRKS
jgi:uncharacterized repeat protein (TIGR01451 family)